MKQKILIIFIISIFLNVFSLTLVYSQPQEIPSKMIKIPTAEAPKTIKEVEDIGKDFLNFLPKEIEKGWDQAIVIWTNMYKKTFIFLDTRIRNFIGNIWNKIKGVSEQKIEEKKDVLQKKLVKEKQEAQETIKETGKKVSKSLWQIILESIGIKKTNGN